MWGTFGMTVVFVVGAIVAHRRLEPWEESDWFLAAGHWPLDREEVERN